ncbi:MAG: AbgT family transporter [Acidobacteria bacterium]|nr:AbgT family transporter [Acidobacteriota bacterium]
MNQRRPTPAPPSSPISQRFLDGVEWVGNKLPDPAFLFVLALFLTWGLSAFLASVDFVEVDPRTNARIQVVNQLSASSLANFLANMVKTFIDFPPLGLVLVALLGVGVAEHTGFIQAALKGLLRLTPRRLLTPMLLLVAILSHSAGDSGYVLIIPLGAVIFAAAGRHPLLGITTAFAGVSGGFSANFLPSSLDPLLQGFTQKAAQIIDPEWVVNPLCNWGFMSASCVVIVGVGWYVADCLIEPRLAHLPVDGETNAGAHMDRLEGYELRGLLTGLGVLAACLITLVLCAWPAHSSLRSPAGDLVGRDAPLMRSIVPLIFLLFLLPGVAHGYVAGTIKSHRDIVQGMTKAMGTISYYLVMAFFAAQFTAAFTQSNLGVLLAVKGANILKALTLPPQVTILGIILLTTTVNLLIGSASAKWALLSPIFVPMLMSLGLSPELTQAAYRVGDSSTNIITPLMPYFPLVVVFAQRYVKNTGIGTLVSLMLPYSLGFLVTWSLLLILYWSAGLPLGLDAGYIYPR